MQITPRFNFIVPLGQSAHQLARQFFSKQLKHRAKQVYLNTLAVYAVRFYLKYMGIETEWEASDSYDPVMQTIMDVADLKIPNLGKLECRPVLPEAESVEIPPEVWGDRIGYIAVQLDESLRKATLLGFIQTASMQEIHISQLKSLKELRQHLRQLSQSEPIKLQVNLSLWLQNIFEPDWRSIEEFSGTNKRYLALRSDSQLNAASVRRAKLINLELYLENRLLTLVVIVTKEPKQSEVFIRAQVHPAGGEAYLPPNLKLALLSESGEFIGETISRSWGLDKYIQIGQIEGLPGECFNIQVAYGKARVTESFLI